MNNRILIVDDEIDFLDIVSEYLNDEGYDTECAVNASNALQILDKTNFDLLLSDINMPGMKGFELLQRAGELYPDMKRALITAYDVNEYFNLAKNHNISNIITKTTPFNFEELKLLINNIISGNIFGLDYYISGSIKSEYLSDARKIEGIIYSILGDIKDEKQKQRFRHALGEIIINAFFYGAGGEDATKKEGWDFAARVTDEKAVKISWGEDEEKFGVSVLDQSGTLSREEILYWLERNTTKESESGLTKGLLDEHGKGIYIAHESIDRLIINIERGTRAEVVMLNYVDGLYDGHRPLWIQET